MRCLPWILVLGCAPGQLDIDEAPVSSTGTSMGFVEPWEQPVTTTSGSDVSGFDGAYARIVSPVAAEVLTWHAPTTFAVEIRDPDGTPMDWIPEASDVQWLASADPDFAGDGAVFDDDTLKLGTHEIMAIVGLPNGDTVSHSVGSVRVQSEYAGTYAGLFSVEGTVLGVTITCTGSAALVVGQQGALGDGDGDCLVSILGADVPMTWDFALENPALDGVVSGDAGVDLLGFFSVRIPATGSLDPDGLGFDVTFDDTIPLVGSITAFLEAGRVSLDAE